RNGRGGGRAGGARCARPPRTPEAALLAAQQQDGWHPAGLEPTPRSGFATTVAIDSRSTTFLCPTRGQPPLRPRRHPRLVAGLLRGVEQTARQRRGAGPKSRPPRAAGYGPTRTDSSKPPSNGSVAVVNPLRGSCRNAK